MAKNTRLFFGIEAYCPWPETYPPGRILEFESRHLTLAFLGSAPLEKALEVAQDLTLPYRIGPVAIADHLLLLKHTAGYHFELLGDETPLQRFYAELMEKLQKAGLKPAHADRPLLNHITIARDPHDRPEWEESFTPLPLYLKDLHLYESLPHSHYHSHFRLPAKVPFEEIPHTADIAFHIWGETISELYQNAACALAFEFSPILTQPLTTAPCDELSEVIIALNELVTKADEEVGCPFKAVSFHGEITKRENLLHWEMIVDV